MVEVVTGLLSFEIIVGHRGVVNVGTPSGVETIEETNGPEMSVRKAFIFTGLPTK